MSEHTFVICAYKASPYLEECIQSLFENSSVKQGKSEIILYTSTPNAHIQRLVEKYGLPYFTKEAGSIGKDWNNALSFVQTKYATIAHQDDIYLPMYGEQILKTFKNKKNALLVFSDYEEIDGHGALRQRNLNLKIKTFALTIMRAVKFKGLQRRIYAFGNFICAPAVSFHWEKLKENHFVFDEKLRMALDWDAWERIMRSAGEVYFLKEKQMYHRIHEGSETTANTVDKHREKEEAAMFRRYWPEFFVTILMKFYVKNQRTNK